MSKKESDYGKSTEDKTSPNCSCSEGGPQGGPDDLKNPKLGIDDFESPGEPQPYAFLIQRPLSPPPDSIAYPFGFVTVHLRAFDGQGNPVPQSIVLSEVENWQEDWTWEVRETDNEIRQACMGRWYAQAACNNGLTIFRVSNAEGQPFDQQLPPGKQSLHGEFMMQGFRVTTIKSIALDWVNHLITGPQAVPPPQYEEWDLVGNQPPATSFDRLHLIVHCNSGGPGDGSVLISDSNYYPRIRLRASLQDP